MCLEDLVPTGSGSLSVSHRKINVSVSLAWIWAARVICLARFTRMITWSVGGVYIVILHFLYIYVKLPVRKHKLSTPILNVDRDWKSRDVQTDRKNTSGTRCVPAKVKVKLAGAAGLALQKNMQHKQEVSQSRFLLRLLPSAGTTEGSTPSPAAFP